MLKRASLVAKSKQSSLSAVQGRWHVGGSSLAQFELNLKQLGPRKDNALLIVFHVIPAILFFSLGGGFVQ